MTLFNAANTPPQQIVANFATALLTHLKGIEAAERLHAYAAAITVADLTAQQPDGPGFSQADAEAMLSAAADAWAEAELYRTGTTTQSYPPGYKFGDSQQRVIAGRVM